MADTIINARETPVAGNFGTGDYFLGVKNNGWRGLQVVRIPIALATTTIGNQAYNQFALDNNALLRSDTVVTQDFYWPGTLVQNENFGFFIPETNLELLSIQAYVFEAPTGSAAQFQIVDYSTKANTGWGCSVSAGAETASVSYGSPYHQFSKDTQWTMKIVSVGSTDPGAYAHVRVNFKYKDVV